MTIRYSPDGSSVRDYRVHVVPQRPAFDDRGVELIICAKNRQKAISEVWHKCYYDRLNGPLRYRIIRN